MTTHTTLDTVSRKTTTERGSARQGFATVYAIILIGLIAVVFSVTTAILTREMRRTASEAERVQLRALLRHAADDGLMRANKYAATVDSHLIPLPPELAGWSVESHYLLDNVSGQGTLKLVATSPERRSLTQVVRLTHTATRWEPVAAELTP